MRDVAEEPPAVRAATRHAAWLTLGFFLLQTAWILTVPPFRGSDEFDHAYRAAGVAGGQWVATEPAQDGRGLLVEVPPELVEAAGPQCSELGYTGPDNCSAVETSSTGDVLVASAAARYFPGYYYLVGKPASMFEGANSLFVMRMVTALMCAAFFFAAAWSSWRRRGSWPLISLFVAATPVLIYSTTIAAPNGVEMAAALSLWSSLLGLQEPSDRRRQRTLIGVAVASASVMCILRLLGPFFVLAIVVTLVFHDHRALLASLRRHASLVFGGTAVVLASLVGFVAWITGPGSSPTPADSNEPFGFDPIYALVWSLQSVAAFPYRNQPGPPIVYGFVGAVVAALLVSALRSSPPRRGAVILGSLAISLVMPFAATALTAGGLGVIWQGRYGLPYSVGFILMCGVALSRSCPPRPLRHGALLFMLAVYGATVIACLIKVRDAEVSENDASLADAAWHVPSTILLVVLVTAAVLCASRALKRPGAVVRHSVRTAKPV